MKRIPLSQGKYALVDDRDFEWLSEYRWFASKCNECTVYAATNITESGKQKQVRMHRMILRAKDGQLTDHVNRNGLDNRRQNIRLCTFSENLRNRPKQKNNTSGYKGVFWHKATKYKGKRYEGKWRAQIIIRGKATHLGYFSSKREAAHAYDKAAKTLHGQFARVNVYA